jgi:flagellar biosynthesis/type III secretory pathway ATPase
MTTRVDRRDAVDGRDGRDIARGSVTAAVGPVVRATGLDGAQVGEVVHVGRRRLLGEIIGLYGRIATIQVYEETNGLEVGDEVQATGAPLLARLGPGLLGSTFDGLQRPLDRLAAAGTWLLLPGLAGAAGRRPGVRRPPIRAALAGRSPHPGRPGSGSTPATSWAPWPRVG